MAARFEKRDDPVMGQFDGFDPKTFYQMVPAGEHRRGFSVISENEEIEVAFDPPQIARFANRTFQPPSPLPFNDYVTRVQPNAIVKFEIFGERAGNTTLTIRNRRGAIPGVLLVSVKSPIDKTYALCRLSDMRRSCPWPESDLRPMMKRVEKTFLHQANITLFEKNTQIFDVNVFDRDLGDPLIPDRIIQPENLRLGDYIFVRRSPMEAISGVNFTIFFTWNLRSTTRPKEIVGQSFGQACFVEFNAASPRENSLTTAHELGHGLGLGHTGVHILMAGDGNSRTSLLQQFEIDMINQTDEQARP